MLRPPGKWQLSPRAVGYLRGVFHGKYLGKRIYLQIILASHAGRCGKAALKGPDDSRRRHNTNKLSALEDHEQVINGAELRSPKCAAEKQKAGSTRKELRNTPHYAAA